MLVDAASATTSATNAAASATSASNAQTAAETAQTAAETAETNAETAQTAAEAAQAAAELAYDNFDDRYLGAKASDPATDNDGNALITGALYFNTTSGMKVYDGSAWDDVKPTTAEQAKIDAVAADATDIGTVATNISNVNTVAGISGNVTTVAGISADVTTVAADGTDIGTVATNISNVNTVAGISANVTTVAGISANVTTVAGISANVTTVAGDTANIGTIATNLNGTDTIGTVAGSISNVNSVGGSITNVNTVATNLTSINSFANTYRIGTTDPTTSLDTGDLFFNTSTGVLKVYTGSAWEAGVTAGSGFLPLTGGTLTGGLTGTTATFTGDLTVDTNVLHVDSTNNRVGIGTSSPTGKLTVDGGSIHLGNNGEGIVFGSDTNTNNAIYGNATSNFIALQTNGTERMRIDSSGNLLHDTTVYSGASSPQNSSSSADAGTVIEAGGTVQIGRYQNSPLRLNRMSTDGAIAEFRKDGTTVGSIRSEGGDIVFGNDTRGLKFRDSDVIPRDMDNTTADDVVSLGSSTSRFKDLYLSGGVVETTTTVSYASSIALSYDNGSIQTVTLTGNVTFTDSIADGESIVLMLNAGASYTVTFPTMTWVSSGGNAAPTLTANDTIVFWKIGSVLYGAYAGSYT